MQYNYDTTKLLSIKQTDSSIIGMLYLAAQKNILHAPLYGIDYDKNKINLNKVNLCKKATNGCVAACIYHNGLFQNAHFSKNKIKQARLKRTMKFLIQKDEFFAKLIKEINSLKTKALKNNLKLAIQLNKTSDILWESESFTYKDKKYKNIMEFFNDVKFFDYTKYDLLKQRKKLPKNYTLTYSRAGMNKGVVIDNWQYLKEVLNKNINIALVCKKDIKEYLLKQNIHNEFDFVRASDYETLQIDKKLENNVNGMIILHEVKRGTNINKNSAFVLENMQDLEKFLQ